MKKIIIDTTLTIKNKQKTEKILKLRQKMTFQMSNKKLTKQSVWNESIGRTNPYYKSRKLTTTNNKRVDVIITMNNYTMNTKT